MATKITNDELSNVTGGTGEAQDYCTTIQGFIGAAGQKVEIVGYYTDKDTASAGGQSAAANALAANANFTCVKWFVSHKENYRSVIVNQGVENR